VQRQQRHLRTETSREQFRQIVDRPRRGKEDEDVARRAPLPFEGLVDRLARRLEEGRIPIPPAPGLGARLEGPVQDLDRMLSAGDLDDRRPAEERREAVRRDRRRGDDGRRGPRPPASRCRAGDR
jgi:hypothetical protein